MTNDGRLVVCLKFGALPKPLTVRKSQIFFILNPQINYSNWAGNSKFVVIESSVRLFKVSNLLNDCFMFS